MTLDARISFVQLAKKLSVSNTLIHQRVRKMKEAGIIENATFRIDPWKLGYETCAYTQIMLDNAKQHYRIESELEKGSCFSFSISVE